MTAFTDDWPDAPDALPAPDGEVHLWRAALDAAPARGAGLERFLSQDETERAARFHFAPDRGRFVAARALLRTLLGRYLGRAPGEIRFGYGPNGKPFVAGDDAAAGLRFNLSHSHGLALCAVTRGREIGVDLEWINATMNVEAIARRFFSAREAAALENLPAGQRQRAFFACWTRKEAYVKARGEGLSVPLGDFSVSLGPSEPPALLEVLNDPGESSRWSFLSIDPAPACVAAVAVEGPRPLLRGWQFPRGVPGAPFSMDGVQSPDTFVKPRRAVRPD